MRGIVWLLLVASPGLAEKVILAGQPSGGGSAPILDNGHSIYLTNPNRVEVFDREGVRLFQDVLMDLAGSSVVNVLSAAVDSDETVAVTAILDLPQGPYGGAIVWLDRSGKQVRVAETGIFVPAHVCFDQNHLLWVFGWQRDETDPRKEARQYSPVRTFSRSGMEEGRYLLRSAFPGRAAPFGTSRESWRARAAGDRVGAILYPEEAGQAVQWIEIDLQGNLLGRWTVAPHARGMAFTGDGRLFVRDWDTRTGAPQLEILERASGRWLPTDNPLEIAGQTFQKGMLLGSDGKQLVFSDQTGAHLLWESIK